MNLAVIIAVITSLYLSGLFGIARFGDKRAENGKSVVTPTVYVLALAVYCTSWTFFGSVGNATTGGFSFMAVYLGPTFMLMFAGVSLKMIRISKANKLTSIADFISARYEKSQFLAGLVTIMAVIGIIPYMALQLKAIAYSLKVLFPGEVILNGAQFLKSGYFSPDLTIVIAVVLAIFTILFGTKHLDATERHEGMMLSVAFESLLKLAVFIIVGIYIVWHLNDGLGDIFQRAKEIPEVANILSPSSIKYGNWIATLILSGLAILMLPRQFQVLVVENVDESHIKKATWMFPLYLIAINIFVMPIAISGLLYFNGQSFESDTLLLNIPLQNGNNLIAILVFLGGLAASTSMVIVESIALSTMVSNDLVVPLLIRMNFNITKKKDLTSKIILIRRISILLVLFLGYMYYVLVGEAYALTSIGLISFLAVAQFAPSLLGGMYWKDGNKNGAIAGLMAGFTVWLYTAFLPAFGKSGIISDKFIEQGIWGQSYLSAQHLFGVTSLDPIPHSLFWSMVFNIGTYVIVSIFTTQSAKEAAISSNFVDINKNNGSNAKVWRGTASVESIRELLVRFLGEKNTIRRLERFTRIHKLDNIGKIEPNANFVMFAETQLAGAIGSASAHVMINSVVQEEELKINEVLSILDETSEIRAQAKEIQKKSKELEHAKNELIIANEKLKKLDELKNDFMSNVTHELRTPLTSIRAFSEMIHDNPDMELEDRTKFLGVIVKESERLTKLINQVLDFAKLESGSANWEMEDINLKDVLKDTTDTLTQLFAERNQTFIMPEHDDVREIMVHVDNDRIKQVIINLLSNASKFANQENGIIKLDYEVKNNEVKVSVSDNGRGVPEEYRELIFERFQQAGDSMTDKPQGTGLGLPISREIITHFGGKIWVEDSKPGVESVFSFTIPIITK